MYTRQGQRRYAKVPVMMLPMSFTLSSNRFRLILALCCYYFGFGIFISGHDAQAQNLTRGPYLQQGTDQSVIIVWRTDSSTDSRVDFSETLGGWQSVTGAAGVTQHEVAITGLKANTTYYYRVGHGSTTLAGGDANYRFRTTPTPGQAIKTRIWVVGDSGTGNKRQAEVRDAMLGWCDRTLPDLYLHMGDMAYTYGSDSQFQNNFFEPYQNLLRNTVCWPTMGNHEGYTSNSANQTGAYYDAYVLPKNAEAGGLASGTEAYYSFDYANAHFVVLDSHQSSRKPNDAMLTWMKNDIAATSQEWLIAFWHHPPYTKGSHDSDTETNLIEMRENALPLLEAAGVDLVLGGHSHIYERSFLVSGAYDTPTTANGKIVDSGDGKAKGNGPYQKSTTRAAGEGAVYVVAGHGGTGVSQKGTHPLMFITDKTNGSCIIDLQGNRLTLTNIRYDGTANDQFTLVKGDALVLTSPNGNENWMTSGAETITWTTVGNIGTAGLDYSTDDGANWQSIVSNVANTGSFQWALPPFGSDKMLVRIKSATDQTVNDESDGVFTIGTLPYNAINFGDEWKFDDQGTDHGQGWLTLDFDDSEWASGKGQLGYGDNDEATKLLNASPNHPSAYFRKKISLAGKVTKADLAVIFDDGIIVWVNGKEIYSFNANNGSDYSAWASSTSEDDQSETASVNLSVDNPFVEGENIVAVMVKQRNGTSSDLSFDLQLSLAIAAPLPPDAGVVPDGSSPITDAGPDDPIDAAIFQYDGTLPGGDVTYPPEDGCQCRTAGNVGDQSAIWLMFSLLFLFRSSRRRSRRIGA